MGDFKKARFLIVFLIMPEVLEAFRREFGILNRILNVTVPHVMLNGTRIMSLAG